MKKFMKRLMTFVLMLGLTFSLAFASYDRVNAQPVRVEENVAVQVIELSQEYSNVTAPSWMDMAFYRIGTVVTDITDTITTTIQELLAGIGSGIVSYFENTFLVTDATGVTDALNTVGIFVFVLLGIGAAFGLATLVFNLVRSRA